MATWLVVCISALAPPFQALRAPLPAAARAGPVQLAALSGLQLVRQSEVLEVLSSIDDPALVDMEAASTTSHDLISLNLVRRVEVDDDTANVLVELQLPVAAASSGAADRLNEKISPALRELEWCVGAVEVQYLKPSATEAPAELSALQNLAATDAVASGASESGADSGEQPGVGAVGHIIAVASCKGGVGKSTTAVNLAYAMAAQGKRVGIVDLDIHGPSLPTMVTPNGKLEVSGEALLPLESDGVKLMSMGFINPGVMPLRGAKVTPVVQQLVGRTVWGALDYLIVDMPPGTGDVQLTLSQDFRVSAAVLVTTPQRLSFVDVVKGVEMFDKVGIPTIAVMENMCGMRLTALEEKAEALIRRHGLPEAAADDLRALLAEPQSIFGASHVTRLREMWGIEASFSLPLLPQVASSADGGVPLVVSDPQSDAAQVYADLASAVDAEVQTLGAQTLPSVMYMAERDLVYITLVRAPTLQASSPPTLQPSRPSPTAVRSVACASAARRDRLHTSRRASRIAHRTHPAPPPAPLPIGSRTRWQPDGSMQKISPRDLRRNCRSPTNDVNNLPEDLHPLDCVPMGNYALSVRWSDGHQSLIPYRSFIAGYE